MFKFKIPLNSIKPKTRKVQPKSKETELRIMEDSLTFQKNFVNRENKVLFIK